MKRNNNVFAIGAIMAVVAVILVIVFIKKPVVPSNNQTQKVGPYVTEIKDGIYSGKCNASGTTTMGAYDDCITGCLQDINCKGYDFSYHDNGGLNSYQLDWNGACTVYTTTPTSASKAKNTQCFAKN